jgi:hypothetical protein
MYIVKKNICFFTVKSLPSPICQDGKLNTWNKEFHPENFSIQAMCFCNSNHNLCKLCFYSHVYKQHHQWLTFRLSIMWSMNIMTSCLISEHYVPHTSPTCTPYKPACLISSKWTHWVPAASVTCRWVGCCLSFLAAHTTSLHWLQVPFSDNHPHPPINLTLCEKKVLNAR